MFILAYFLYSNIALMIGMLFALITQSKRRNEELANTRLDVSRGLSAVSLLRNRHTPGDTQQR